MKPIQILTVIEAELGYVELGKLTVKERVNNILAEIKNLSENKKDASESAK